MQTNDVNKANDQLDVGYCTAVNVGRECESESRRVYPLLPILLLVGPFAKMKPC